MRFFFLLMFTLIFLSPCTTQASRPAPEPEIKCGKGICTVDTLIENCTLPEGTEVKVSGDFSPSGSFPPNYKDPNTGTYIYGHNAKILISQKKITPHAPLTVQGKIHYCGDKICGLTHAKIYESDQEIIEPTCQNQELIEHVCKDKRCINGKCSVINERDCSYWQCAPDN